MRSQGSAPFNPEITFDDSLARTLDQDKITHIDFVYELSKSRCHLHSANDSNM